MCRCGFPCKLGPSSPRCWAVSLAYADQGGTLFLWRQRPIDLWKPFWEATSQRFVEVEPERGRG
jgi:hypothetical protein